MKIAIILFLFLGLNSRVYAQTPSDTNNIGPKVYAQIVELLNGKFHGYHIMDTILGDLNVDGWSDCVVVLEREINEELTEESFLEIDRITVFLVQQNGVYLVKASNPLIVECRDCGGAGVGDPYKGITVNNGLIVFESYYGACDKTYVTCTFQFNRKKQDWFLIEKNRNDYNCNDITEDGEVSVKSKTETRRNFGKVTFSEFQTIF